MSGARMSPERWERIKALFGEASEMPSSQRAAWLEQACRGDAALREDVESLLRSHDAAGSFIETPALASTAQHPGAVALEGRMAGPYRIVREIARGGMGAVYLAVRADDAYRKQVAVKVIKRGMDSDEIVARFRQERQTLATLDHPNIARLLDAGTTDDGLPYFVMEYVEGQPLDRYCDERRLDVTGRLRLFRTVCDAVQFAHRNLVVHRDLKPANILVTADGTPKLLDFGIAKVLGGDVDGDGAWRTRDTDRLMTVDYASPEQLKREPVSTATDVFSLGVMLYELLTGVHPFRRPGQPSSATETAIQDEDPPRPSATAPERNRARRLQGDLDAIVGMALRKEPARRYGSAFELNEDIRRHLEGLPVAAHRESAGYLAAKFVRRHTGGVIATSLVGIALIAGVIGTTWQARVAKAERDRARLEAVKAERVSAVLQELFRAPDPSVDGRNVTVAQVLDDASKRIATDLKDQPDVRAAVRAAIGNTYYSLGLMDRARLELRESVALLRELHGEDDARVLRARVDLASVTIEQGDLDVAEKAVSDALQRLPQRADTEDTRAEALNALGLIAARRSRGEEAVARYREALDIRRRLYGDRHQEVAEILNNIAVQAQTRGDLVEAERLYTEALNIVREFRGEEFPGYAAGLSNLANVLQSQGKLPEARKTYERALDLRRQLLGADHPSVAFTEFNYSDLLLQLKEYDSALALTERILERRGKSLPPKHPMVPAALLVSGRARLARGDGAGAERDIRESVAIRREILPPGHWLIANTESVLGECLAVRGKMAEATRLLKSSYEALLASRGPNHERTRDARERLERFGVK